MKKLIILLAMFISTLSFSQAYEGTVLFNQADSTFTDTTYQFQHDFKNIDATWAVEISWGGNDTTGYILPQWSNSGTYWMDDAAIDSINVADTPAGAGGFNSDRMCGRYFRIRYVATDTTNSELRINYLFKPRRD